MNGKLWKAVTMVMSAKGFHPQPVRMSMKRSGRNYSTLLVVTCGLMTMMVVECGAQCPAAKPETARITITLIPRAGEGGPDRVDQIAGNAAGVNVEEARVVVYAHAGDRWWVQPLADNPFTVIGADGGWQTNTHLGSEYAALLVHKAFSPGSQSPSLPDTSNCVWAVATAMGRSVQSGDKSETPRQPTRTIAFAGYDWMIKSGRSAPGPNLFSNAEENVRVDEDGKLHLRITYRDGQWYCAEVVSRRSLGYGTYRFSIVSSIHGMDPNVVLGLFTWSDNPAFAHRELDIEISRWGLRDNDNAQFVVQPYDQRGHIVRFFLPSNVGAIHSFVWHEQNALFESRTQNGDLVQRKTFSEGIPQAGGENVRINLWLVNGQAPKDGGPVEVVLDRFDFTTVPAN